MFSLFLIIVVLVFLFCFCFVLKHKLDNAEAYISMFLPERMARLFLQKKS